MPLNNEVLLNFLNSSWFIYKLYNSFPRFPELNTLAHVFMKVLCLVSITTVILLAILDQHAKVTSCIIGNQYQKHIKKKINQMAQAIESAVL